MQLNATLFAFTIHNKRLLPIFQQLHINTKDKSWGNSDNIPPIEEDLFANKDEGVIVFSVKGGNDLIYHEKQVSLILCIGLKLK